jgi:hypothetical protein
MRVNPSQLPNHPPTPDPHSYDAVEVLGLTWFDRNDQACLRRIISPPVATRLVHMKAKAVVADTLRAITVERAYGRLSEHAFRAMVVTLADLLWPAEGEAVNSQPPRCSTTGDLS